jgi:hypothetical protein
VAVLDQGLVGPTRRPDQDGAAHASTPPRKREAFRSSSSSAGRRPWLARPSAWRS